MSEENKFDRENTKNENSFEYFYNSESADAAEEKNIKSRKKTKISLTTFIVSLIAVMLAAVMTTWSLAQSLYRRDFIDSLGGGLGARGEFAELDLLKGLIENYSYFDMDEERMMEVALKSYVAATGDRYAAYYTEEEFKEYNDLAAGNSVGVGINIIYTTETINEIEYLVLRVINVTRDSPAEKAGVKIGDMVFYVGTDPETRQSIHEIGYEKAYNSLIGESGTQAEFTVIRKNAEGEYDEVAFSITRAKIETDSVYAHVCDTDKSVGIVKITGFEYNTPAQFSAAIDKMRAQGIEKFVFDVRYNGGGALHSIVAILSYFLDEGQTIISTVDKSGAKKITKVGVVNGYDGDSISCNVSKEDIGKYKDLKVAVLCNESTASAAELFTATFRDYKIGKTVGVTTFGKGSMQSILSLDYFGYSGAVKLTTNMYFPPCGESYEGIGITPDVEIERDASLEGINIYEVADADDNQLQAAIEILK